jgi:cobalt/nickel transport protein
MRTSLRLALALLILALLAPSVQAHFSMFFPSKASVKKGETVTLIYMWGHPFEHELFDAPSPESWSVFSPDGKQTNLDKKNLEVAWLPGGKGKVLEYRLEFTPKERGDYLFVLKTPPIWLPEEKEFVQDTVRVVLHVQTQKGWDTANGAGFDMVPLTRPYGLQAGMMFQAQVLAPVPAIGATKNKPLAGALVEIERYNPERPKELPPDEHITRAVKTDPNGVFTCTLTKPGWWCLTAQRDAGTRKHEGTAYPLRERITHWVYVDPPLKTKTEK